MRGDLNSFFNPKSIAIVGASNTPFKVGNILMKKLKNYKGEIFPINPNDPTVEGKKAYKRLIEISQKIDLVVIATPSKTVLKILKDVVFKGIKNVIIITAGFSEIGNKKEEIKILDYTRKHGINVLGPNCFGLINTEKNVDLTFSKETVKSGDVVFISQSGALGSFVMDLEIGLRAFISLGNMMDLGFADWIEYFSHDEKTKKIVLYIEKLKEGRRFIEACKNSKKEIIAVKSGKTETGKKATMSHTGSLATDFEIYKGAFVQADVKYMESLSEAFSLEKESVLSSLKGKNIAIITNAGGAGALLTDELEKNGFKVYGPKDILGTATPSEYRKALNKIRGNYDNIIVAFTPQTMSDAVNTARVISKSHWRGKIIAVFLGEKSVKDAVEILRGENIPVFTRAI